ncbi:unnamed protein product [Dracunculus medinensis]|uniref:Uncharacterized protein n=1 Tax=Dracunculus medinensis TaxID=318479 RepID=A0A0N4U0E0_DRAME|nr:unnamed protein product [Dracunculus medinensis]
MHELSKNIEEESKNFKASVLRITERTLKGAGDEIEDFFGEVPNTVAEKVNNGVGGLLTKADEGISWIFRNIIVPIISLFILIALIYLAVISGCCGFCCSSCLALLCEPVRNRFKKTGNTVSNERFVIVCKSTDDSVPLTYV